MPSNVKRKLVGVAGAAALAWLGASAAVAASQRKLLFNPGVETEVENPQSEAHKTRRVVIRGADGTRLAGWFLSPLAPGVHPAVLYFGGRSEEVSWVVRDAGRLFPGMAVLVVNYRGYGNSQGEPGEQQFVSDGRTLYDWLIAQPAVDPARIALVGRSLGTGVAIQVAATAAIQALVLITPYDSIQEIARRRFRGLPIALTLRHRFQSAKHVQSVTAPVLVLRAEVDTVVPHARTDALITCMPSLSADETIAGSDHCNIPYLVETQARIAAFLTDKLLPAPASSTASS